LAQEEGKKMNDRNWWIAFIKRYVKFNRGAFGETGDIERRLSSITQHLRKEIAELNARPNDLHEYADVALLSLDLATRGMEWADRDIDVIAFILGDILANTLPVEPRPTKFNGIYELIADVTDVEIDPEIRGYLAFRLVRWSYHQALKRFFSPEDWYRAIEEKLAINEARQWPPVVDDGYVEHVREPDLRLVS
jgi:hypothetical protein